MRLVRQHRARRRPPARQGLPEETCAAIEEVTTGSAHHRRSLRLPRFRTEAHQDAAHVVDGKPVAALVRGDRELNEIKLKNYFKADEVVLTSPEQVTQ